jgi:hypothetical protein
MRNLGLVFIFIVSGLFLQGCDPVTTWSVTIKDKKSPSTKIDNRKLEVTKAVESILGQYGFFPSHDHHVEGVSLAMEKNPSNRHGKVYISVHCENNIIQIYTMEWGRVRMSDFTLRLQNEIADKLNQLFKDCCIIIKDNECFEDSK